MNINNYIIAVQGVVREWYRWRLLPKMDGYPHVYYGFESLPSPKDVSGGGIIKTQDLQEKFPNTLQHANILYLISSALPIYAVRMAKLAQKRGVKVVLNQNGVAYPGWCQLGWQQYNSSMRALLEVADYVIYQSLFCKHCADKWVFSRDQDYEVLLNPVDTEIFTPPRRLTVKVGKVTLLLAGSHCHTYRVKSAIDTLVELRKKNIEAHLIIAGRFVWLSEKNPMLDVLKMINESECNDFIKITGTYSQEEAPALFQSADILLHTKYNDPCPRLVAEALACGVPVVYSHSGGVPELVGEHAGFGVRLPLVWDRDLVADPRQLADGVIHVVEKYDLYTQIARKRAQEVLDVRPWVSRHDSLFTNLLSS